MLGQFISHGFAIANLNTFSFGTSDDVALLFLLPSTVGAELPSHTPHTNFLKDEFNSRHLLAHFSETSQFNVKIIYLNLSFFIFLIQK